jgi:hypothetical protein
LPGIDDDWFLAEHIERFYTADEFLQRMREAVDAGHAPADAVERIEALLQGERQDLIRESLIAAWEHAGLRDWVRERQRHAAAESNPYAPPQDGDELSAAHD